MRLSATTIPLVIYVVGFQTLVYLLLPLRFRPTWAPLVTSTATFVEETGVVTVLCVNRSTSDASAGGVPEGNKTDNK